MGPEGLQGLWFHDLRGSFVTRARKHRIPESVVMRMSGHRTRAVFDRYNVVDDEDLRAAVRALEILGRPPETPKPHHLSLGRASVFRSCGGRI